MMGCTTSWKALSLALRSSGLASGVRASQARRSSAAASTAALSSSRSSTKSSAAEALAARAAFSHSLRALTASSADLSASSKRLASSRRVARSFSLSRRPSFRTTRFFVLSVARSRAATWRMPFASRSKVTRMRGTPRGAGGIPSREKVPKIRLSLVRARSPSKILTSTAGWLSAKVVKTCSCLAGMVVLRSTMRVMTPPAVSMPSESGATSRRTRPPRSAAAPREASTAAWTAAP
mmetsp:Transcript_21771/g.68200  ORF Transcript_21771/g.68200 Transcript_21771/m.68200 type:complete len:236 (-) Transcript_21771:1129-1836(-)